MNAAVAARLDADSTYFYVSYAHVPPPPGQASVETNYWVKRFFNDLESAVRRVRAETPARIGFCDVLLSPHSNRRERVLQELGLTEVLVPLYAPGYFSRARSKSEWDAFVLRAEVAGAAQPQRHVCPVLWVPMPSDARVPQLARARRLGVGIKEYTEEGLQAMLTHRVFYRESYMEILHRLAKRIVRIAERETLGPSLIPEPSTEPEKIYVGTPFTLAVYAPTARTRPRGRRSEPYGETRTQWRPYRVPDDLSIADIASNVVEWFDLNARAEEFDGATELFGRGPGVVLVDPWVIDRRNGPGELRDAVAALPPWVSMIVVVDTEDPQYDSIGANLTHQAEQALASLGRQVSVAHDVEGFEQVLVQSIMLAQNAYLRKGPVHPPDGPLDTLPRLTGDYDETPSLSEEVDR
jgi:FxsC-like protein